MIDINILFGKGCEEDYIIISVVHTSTSGYVEDPARTNAILTRCRVGMVLVANRTFVMSDDNSQSLVRVMVQERGNVWMDCSEVSMDGQIFLSEVIVFTSCLRMISDLLSYEGGCGRAHSCACV
jgi:hypothetical protein